MEMQHKRKHMMSVSANNVGELFLWCDSCDTEVDYASTSLEDLNKAAEAHIREKEFKTEKLSQSFPVARRQTVVDFEDPTGSFLISDRMLTEIPFSTFEDFKAVMDQEIAERDLILHVYSDPNGILLKWEPRV